MNKKIMVLAFLVIYAGFLSGSATAQSQSCTVQKDIMAGSPIPPGYIVISDGIPDFAVLQYPQCSQYVCEECQKRQHSAGSPIDLATGNTYIRQDDIRLPGLGGGLSLSRTWNSIFRSSLNSIGMFGPNWRSTYEERIYVDDDYTIAYARGDGAVWNFVLGASATFTPAPPPNAIFTYRPVAPASLTAALFWGSSTWTLVLQNGEQRVFDEVTGNLLSITDRNGNTTQLAYDDSYRLTTVTDPAGRHLYFTYGQQSQGILGAYYLVTSVSSDAGISLSYAYDSLARLAQVTYPDNTTNSFEYNSPSASYLITAVLDSVGQVLESHTYFQCPSPQSPIYGWLGRGLTSARANGAEAVSVSYNTAGYNCVIGQ